VVLVRSVWAAGDEGRERGPERGERRPGIHGRDVGVLLLRDHGTEADDDHLHVQLHRTTELWRGRQLPVFWEQADSSQRIAGGDGPAGERAGEECEWGVDDDVVLSGRRSSGRTTGMGRGRITRSSDITTTGRGASGAWTQAG
jgi:hypothetical protein